MTRDIAIRYCDEYLERRISDIDKEFLKIAKEALQQEPCEDAISRQAVIDGINEYFHDEYYQRTSIQDCRDCLIKDVIKDMPSVTPQPKCEWQQDHEILKAYSDGANDALDEIRANIAELWKNEPCPIEYGCLNEILQIIDKYKAERGE